MTKRELLILLEPFDGDVEVWIGLNYDAAAYAAVAAELRYTLDAGGDGFVTIVGERDP